MSKLIDEYCGIKRVGMGLEGYRVFGIWQVDPPHGGDQIIQDVTGMWYPTFSTK